MAFLNVPRLLDFAKTPPHLQFNKYVLTGYRPVATAQDCLCSLFYLHNEFGNIYTHGALPIVHITLLCYPVSRLAAMLSYTLLSAYGIYSATTARSNTRRLRAFAWQALFRLGLFLLRWGGPGAGSPSSLRLFLTMDLLALLGGLVNISRVPERFHPGLFDYWCNSHQIMHVLVICSIVYLHWGMMEDLAWLRTFQCPGEG
ncbi:progestin and adipoQ receptor family member 4-like isoform X2 [Hypomesus transpacificus]|uniref:progestin and adipoQ receptor family member 4-like isoform X2 n=1 Tax=Hypomesus transpacificus TaxID=137520 RepID=UPI001F07937C|nr:progestin and adipoQ receptor family member 4-like isoform X2 [Hypomesus transpacificus]